MHRNQKRMRASYRPSLTDDVLSLLVDRKAPYRIFHRMLEGRYESLDLPMPSDAVLRATMSRLKKNGLLTRKGNAWELAKRGLARLRRSKQVTRIPHAPSRTKNMIILYDVPERDRRKRDWLRSELVMLGFSMLRQSDWFGPGPLPREFIEAAHKIGVLQHMRFFSAKEEDIV